MTKFEQFRSLHRKARKEQRYASTNFRFPISKLGIHTHTFSMYIMLAKQPQNLIKRTRQMRRIRNVVFGFLSVLHSVLLGRG